jgi:hypothetical protein
MKWIVIAIIAVIIPYTWLTLHYRKPGPAYRPYEDGKERANVERLLSAGYQRVTALAERPADPQQLIRTMGVNAAIVDVPGGLPAGLATTLVEAPLLSQSFASVSAPREIDARRAYTILLNCSLANQKAQLGGSQLFIKGNTAVIVPQFEPIQGTLLARSNESMVTITIPGGTFKPGRYTVTLAASQHSKQWTVDVR